MNRRDILRSGAALAGVGTMATAITNNANASAGGLVAMETGRSTGFRGFVTGAGGTQLRVRDWGHGNPVVLLAGWGLPSDFWHYHALDLTAAGQRCISCDRRGHGRSDEPGDGYDYDTLADDLAAVLDALDLRDVTLVAYSMAGGEAVRYLTRHGGKRIARIVFAAATLPCLVQKPDNPQGVPKELLATTAEAIATDFPSWLVNAESPFWLGLATPAMMDWGRDLMMQTSVPVLSACYRSMISSDFRNELSHLTLPALILHGSQDASAPLAVTGARTAELMPKAKVSIYDGAPHGLPLTHRRRFVRDLLEFIRA